MSDFVRKVATARATMLVALEQALADLGDGFVRVGEKLRSEDLDAEKRAAYLTSDEAGQATGGTAYSSVSNLFAVLKEFDRIEKESESAPVKYQVRLESDKYSDRNNPGKLNLLLGQPALLKRYLLKAGYKLEVELHNGYYFFIVISRPA